MPRGSRRREFLSVLIREAVTCEPNVANVRVVSLDRSVSGRSVAPQGTPDHFPSRDVKRSANSLRRVGTMRVTLQVSSPTGPDRTGRSRRSIPRNDDVIGLSLKEHVWQFRIGRSNRVPRPPGRTLPVLFCRVGQLRILVWPWLLRLDTREAPKADSRCRR